MKYIVEINIPKYIEVEANSEDEARERVKSSLDPKQREIAEIKVAKEVKLWRIIQAMRTLDYLYIISGFAM